MYFCGVDSTFTDMQNEQNKLFLFYWYCTAKEKLTKGKAFIQNSHIQCQDVTMVEEKETCK